MQIFTNEQFGTIRTVEIDGEIYFVAADVCKILELTNPTVAVSRLEEDERAKLNLGHPYFETNCVNESGLYRLIFASRKSDAKKFQRWVFHEVLPAIRKHGAYFKPETAENILNNPYKLMEIFQNFIAEREEKEKLQAVVEVQNVQIAELTPKASYYDLVLNCKDLVPITQIAKDYGMCGRALNKILHDLKIQYRCAGTWLVYQNYAAKGYTVTKTIPISEDFSKTHTHWTQKGRLGLYELLKNHGYLPTIEKSAD